MSTTRYNYILNVLNLLTLRNNNVVAYIGNYIPGNYIKGDLVTFGGIFYIADVDTANAPPNSDWLPFTQSSNQCILFTSDVIYPITSTGRYIIAGVGGGGGGSFSTVTDSITFIAGPGGGSGYFSKFNSYLTSGTNLDIQIGAGGPGLTQFSPIVDGEDSTVSYTNSDTGYISTISFKGGECSRLILGDIYRGRGGNGYFGGGAAGHSMNVTGYVGGSSAANITSGEGTLFFNFRGGMGSFSDSISYPNPPSQEYAIGGSGGGFGSGNPGNPFLNQPKNGTNALPNTGAGGGGASVYSFIATAQTGNGGNGGSGWVCLIKMD